MDNSGNEWKIINDARKADWRQALKWLQKAASKNYTEAQYQLGLGYYDGSLNPEEASLIEKGDGRDVPTDVTDYRQAFKWCLKAAQQHHAEAQEMIASLYEEGLDVPRNIHKAVEWYKKACANGYEEVCGKTEIQDYMRH